MTQILEARHHPGVIALEPDLILRLLDNVYQEIACNGQPKIVLVNAHSGNFNLIRFFAQSQLASRHDYVVNVIEPGFLPEDKAAIKAQWEMTYDGHAGESETSQILAMRPDLPNMDKVSSEPEGMPLERLKALRDAGIYNGIWWYANHPTHNAVDARSATATKGERELDAHARDLAVAIRAINQDDVSKPLQDEFFVAVENKSTG